MDVLRIKDLRVDCIVGAYPHERTATQPLNLDVALHLDTVPGAESERVSDTVDYGATASQIVFLLRSCRFRLLETASHVLARYMLAPPAPGEARVQVTKVDIDLTKPGALSGFATPSLSITRRHDAFAFRGEVKEWGTVDVIHETRDAGIYRLNIAPGKGIPMHEHHVMQESEMILTRGVYCQQKEMPVGTVHRWPRRAAHCYDNPTERWQSILCVDCPKFDPEDEVLVEREPDDVPTDPPWAPIATSI